MQTFRLRALVLVVVAGSGLLGLAGCTALLGDFNVEQDDASTEKSRFLVEAGAEASGDATMPSVDASAPADGSIVPEGATADGPIVSEGGIDGANVSEGGGPADGSIASEGGMVDGANVSEGGGPTDGGSFSDGGCEAGLTACAQGCVSLSSPGNCGGCGHDCTQLPFVSSTGVSCVASECVITSCVSPYADCDSVASNGCEVNLTTDVNHCGMCGTSCNLAHATSTCHSSGCVIASCSPGYADCDGVASNGCETDITLPANCGACNTATTPTACTAAAPVCSAGTCVTGCPVSTPTLCAGNSCVDTTQDPNHCGGCATTCGTNHASEVCSGSMCAVSSCAPGYVDCDGVASNGCEVNITTDASNCGGCRQPCSSNNATEACTTTGCAIVSCATGFADCDGLASTGCEINTMSDKNNCSRCGAPCPVSAQTCVNSACQCPASAPTFCAATNTCVLTTSDNNNCGGCGQACPPAESCVASVCSCPAGAPTFCSASDTCVLTSSDPNNCGACGHTCGGGTTCQNGACTCPAGTPMACNGTCVNPSTDPMNCGQCGNTCIGRCLSGVCQCVTPDSTNLLTNGGFNTNVTGWTPLDPNIVLTFASLDAAECATSGSVLAANQAPDGLNSGFIQCVPVVAGQSYDVGGRIRTPSGGAQGQTLIQMAWFTAPNCQGSISVATELFASGTFDAWELLSQDNLVAPSGTASAYVYGQLIKNLPDTRAYQAYYDMMYLSPSPGHF